MTKPGLHTIYGLYLTDQPAVILYVGSWCAATLDERLRQHREGEAPRSRKMAVRDSINIRNLQMHVLTYWMAGIEPNPEGEITRGLQARGQCRWNHPYAFTTGDAQRGGRKTNATWGRTAEAHEHRVRTGRKVQATWGQTSEGHEAHARGGRRLKESGWSQTREGQETLSRAGHVGGRKGGLIGGRALADSGWHESPEGHKAHVRAGCNQPYEAKILGPCTRWHADRPKINRLCTECAALVLRRQIP